MQRHQDIFQKQKGKSYSQGKLGKSSPFQQKCSISYEQEFSNLRKIERKKYDQQIQKQRGQLKKINQTIKQKKQLITEVKNKFLVLCDQFIELQKSKQSQGIQIAYQLQDLSEKQANLFKEKNNLLKDQAQIKQRLKKKKKQQFFMKEKEQQPFSEKNE